MEEKKKALLVKYLEGKCSKAEAQVVQELLSDPNNRSLIDTLAKTYWDHPVASFEIPTDLEEQWKERLRARIQTTEQLSQRQRVLSSAFYRYAALWIGSLLVVASVFLLFIHSFNSSNDKLVEVINKGNLPMEVKLPDNSTVFIGPDSRLSYAKRWKKERTVQLTGVGYFEIEEDASRPFKVYTQDIETTVLGTSFLVETGAQQSVAVSVASGKVKVSHIQASQRTALAVLKSGDRINWNQRHHVFDKQRIDPIQIDSWKAGGLLFSDLPLSHIIAILERRFQRQITISDTGLRTYKMTAYFKSDKTLDDILNTLALAGEFKIGRLVNGNFTITMMKEVSK